MSDDYVCRDCKQKIDLSHTRVPAFCGGAGYGQWGDDPGKICYPCCAKRHEQEMDDTGKTCLYLVPNLRGVGYHISDWAGNLKFNVHNYRHSKHNMARSGRIDVWFVDRHGKLWHGVNIGDMQLTRCKRLKRQPNEAPPRPGGA